MSPSDSAKPNTKGKEVEEKQEGEENSSQTTPNEASDPVSSKSSADEGENNEQGEQPGPSSSGATPTPTAETPPQWQAIWSPEYNAYYFFNPTTQETTWVNPLQPEASSSATAASSSSSATQGTEDNAEAGQSTGPVLSAVAAQHAALQAAALAQGIDPLLAHLDPSLLTSTVPGSTGPADLPTFTAKFNARTGQFAPMSSRTPGHLSEYERAKRMSEFYFDVNKWEEDLAKRGGSIMAEEGDDEEGGSGKKRKRPTKKDLERFKEQKRLKKIAKTAWLRT
ncbi:hypothetical protein M413DRAFT_449258 [Hebeloma cylindrosporum]|uniref:WW domain-containing protein n=1 Tax=Hebeloma cylindrosporum TaxID=76867 RepID=A0A0C2Y5Q6_HEBCY|nr:hypothetical protein M413DRAFT_449258 [Hebeloma cylindrosporum h7]